MQYLARVILPVIIASTTAAAAEDSLGPVGTVAAGFTYEDVELTFDGETETPTVFSVNGSGAALFGHYNRFEIQGNFDFVSHNIDPGGECCEFGLDQSALGGKIFTRGERGLLGVEGDYRREDGPTGVFDGYRVGLRGERYTSDQWTVAFGVGYNFLNNDGCCTDDDLKGLDVNGSLTFYSMDNVALSARIGYDKRRFDTYDGDIMSFGGGIEWTHPKVPMAVALNVDYYDSEGSDGAGDIEFSNLQGGLRLKFYFGSSGSMANLHRTSTLDTDLGPNLFEFIVSSIEE